MSSDKRNISVNDYEMNIDLYSILRDIWKYALVIMLLAASMSLLSYVYVGRNYHKQYESTSTFIVSSKGSNNSIYSDLSATSEMATKFSEILFDLTKESRKRDGYGLFSRKCICRGSK